MANNNFPQITSVTSEALQSQVRTLLPSQEGFGTDLMAQNVIVPVIDLTSAAEGSSVGQNLQTAYAFGSQTAFSVSGSTQVIANTAGFWRVNATGTLYINAGTQAAVTFQLSDGVSTKDLFKFEIINTTPALAVSESFDFVVFLNSGESISAISNLSSYALLAGSARQIADINGTLINPSGFTPQ